MAEGQRLGRYVLQKRLGRGGMAEVWLAQQDGPAGFSKQVVVKRILRSMAQDERMVASFLREARLAARLNHPNVVQVFELAELDGDWLIAMEFLDGLSLRRAARRAWARGEDVPMEVALRAIADAALGLHHAHTLTDASGATPLVHRDISPDNLMLVRAGVTKVVDFGIAKITGDDDALTQTGEIKGKVPYLAPEQIDGVALDGRTDLWALGVTLYWLLTGERPFVGDSEGQVLRAILAAAPRPPRELNPLIPARVQALVLSLLEKDRARRPASGAVLAEQIRALLGPAAAGPESAAFAARMLEARADDDKPLPAERTTPASRPLTRWLIDEGAAPAAGGTARDLAAAGLAPRAPLRGVLFGVAAFAVLATVAGVALFAPSPAPPPGPPPVATAQPTDAGALAPDAGSVDAGAGEARVVVADPLDAGAVDAGARPPRVRRRDAGPAPVDDPPPPPPPAVVPSAEPDDASVVRACDKPCADLYRSAVAEGRSAASLAKMAKACASVCRSQ